MIPNLFTKQSIPEKLPELLDSFIQDTLSEGKTDEYFVEKCFAYIVDNWGGNRYNLVFTFLRLFEKDISKSFNTQGYMHCTTMNYILRIMLVKGNIVSDNNVVLKLTNTWYIAPHQYLAIQLKNGKSLTLDPWSYQFGVPYGRYGRGFDSMKKFHHLGNKKTSSCNFAETGFLGKNSVVDKN